MVFPVVLYKCESRTIKEAFLSAFFHQLERIDNFEVWCWRRFESPLDSKEIKPVNPKGNQPWIFIGRTEAEAEAPILWSHDAKSWLTGKDPDAGSWIHSPLSPAPLGPQACPMLFPRAIHVCASEGETPPLLCLVDMSVWQWSLRTILHLWLSQLTGHLSYCIAQGTLLNALQ